MCFLKLHFIITIFNLTPFNSCVLEATGCCNAKKLTPCSYTDETVGRTTVNEQTYSLRGHKHLP